MILSYKNHYNTNITSTNITLKRKFGGKEYQDELGLDWYDITARNYDPALGRWFGIDNLAENHYENSPFIYTANNPIVFVDIDGNDYGVTVIRPSNNSSLGTITISATYLVHGNIQSTVNSRIIDIYNTTSGQYVFVSGGISALKNGNHEAYLINYDLDTQVENSPINRTARVINDISGTLNKIDTASSSDSRLTNKNGITLNDAILIKDSRIDTSTTTHEAAHTMGVDHVDKNGGNLPIQGIKINNKIIAETLAGVGIGGNNIDRNHSGSSKGAGDGILLQGSSNKGLENGIVISRARYDRIRFRFAKKQMKLISKLIEEDMKGNGPSYIDKPGSNSQ